LVSDIHREKRFIKRYSGRICSDDLWKKAFDRLDTLYSLYFKDVVDSSLVKINDYEDTPITLNSKSCGCSHKEELNGGVFGFYPYWYAGDSTKWVDFEGITRLAYYGLQVDESGSLHTAAGTPALTYFGKKENYEFVNEVHRHNVKLDWVIYKDDWSNVSIDAISEKLIAEIDSLLNTKVNSYFQRFVNAFTFYTDEFENRGDGVILFFKNYPTDGNSTKSFNKFFGRLKRKLAESNESVHVNMMMERADLAIDKKVKPFIQNWCDKAYFLTYTQKVLDNGEKYITHVLYNNPSIYFWTEGNDSTEDLNLNEISLISSQNA
jgi:hypothetical protein